MSIGAQLRASREARGLSLDAVAHTTRVQLRILAAIERDDVRGVPPRPFGRGFVRAYAREMGLDGDQTTRDYFAQFAPVVATPPNEAEKPVPAGSSSATRVLPVALVSAGVLTAIVIAVVATRPAAKSNSPSAHAAIVGTSGTATAASSTPKSTDAAPPAPGVAAASERAAAPVPAANAAAPVAAAPLTIVLSATKPSWVTADADGRRAVYRTVAPGSPETITAKREIVIRVGNAGAIAWQINGRDAGSMGRQGQVRDVTITPKTAATIR